ncbi:endonuclease domain-containing protein [Brevibacterium sp. JSBI002]|uniref:endonuclease domain-containing protein n=1 Tax=Brevibacterium sp. JSBI002 TaxID=2886045 RepID=UPI00222E95FF|nr:endonuclease domain-containing protein [Brevibacterium sp. JSBI002]UZD62919.1 endonuclease domain-containing protein [Brevibacterium sp. JSBI002]
MTTEKLYRLGFTKDEVRRGERCCLTRIARGRYVATGSCDEARHEIIWAALSEADFEEFGHQGDMRDEIEPLRVLIRTRAERIHTASGRWRVTKGREVFSHLSAALVHGLPIAYPAETRVEVFRPNVSRKYRYLYVRNREVPSAHRKMVGIYAVTTMERTLIDIARDYPPDVSVPMLDEVIRRGRTTRFRIEAVLAECPESRGDTAVVRALDLTDGRREAPSESIAAVRFFEHGITGFEPQVDFFGHLGEVIARVDFCNHDARLIVEIDGLEKYTMEGRSTRESLAAEKAREAAVEARGYKIIRLTFGDLFRTAPFERILGTLATRLRTG